MIIMTKAELEKMVKRLESEVEMLRMRNRQRTTENNKADV